MGFYYRSCAFLISNLAPLYLEDVREKYPPTHKEKSVWESVRFFTDMKQEHFYFNFNTPARKIMQKKSFISNLVKNVLIKDLTMA